MLFLQQGEELSIACGDRVTSLLLVQKRSNQEKTTPRLALAGHPARQVREPGPGFSTAHPCAGEKESASCRFPLRGLSPPAHRRTGAPGRAAGHPGPHSVRSGSAAATAEKRAALPGLQNSIRSERSSRERAKLERDVVRAVRLRLCGLRSGRMEGENSYSIPMSLGPALAFASAVAFDSVLPGVRAGCAPLLWGPCAAVRDGRQARRVIGRDADHFSSGQESGRKTRPALTDLPGRKPGKRQAGWPSLLVTFLLATQEKSDSVAAGDRPLFALNAARARASRTRCAPTGASDRRFFATAAASRIAGAFA